MFLALKSKLLATDVFVDSEYLDKYINLIVDNVDTVADSTRTQYHHIIPRSYFEHKGLPVDNSATNMVHLLYKDHILAHYYLALSSIGSFQYAMENAFMMLTNFSFTDDKELIYNLDKYQQIYESVVQYRRGVSPVNKGKPMSEEQKKKISNTLKGHSVSQESREKMRLAQLNMSPEARARVTAGSRNRNYTPTAETLSKQSAALKGHEVSAETRAKIGEGNKKQLGNKWYTDGNTCVLVRPGELVPEGFVRGTLRKKRR